MQRKTATQGFTLIELMIAVAIVGILAAIAYPSYIEHVRKTRRADAKAVVLELSQWMERFYTENSRYDKTRAGVDVALPFTQSPLPPISSSSRGKCGRRRVRVVPFGVAFQAYADHA